MDKTVPTNSTLEQEIIDLIKKAISDATNPAPRADELLGDSQAAKILGIAKGTLPVWRHQGKGPPYVKIGSNVRYRYSDLQKFIESKRQSL